MNAALRADWPAPPGINAFTTLRYGAGVSLPPFDHFNLGARCGDDPLVVATNRAELVERFALPSSPHWLQQVHGVDVIRLSAPPPAKAGGGWEGVASESRESNSTPPQPSPAFAGEGAEPIADASVTSTPGTVLAILTADCLPVVFAADDGSAVGAAHAGWRGLAGGVLENTVAAMDVAPERLIAWLGPAAGPQAYEIGQEVFDAFVSRDARAASAFVATRPGHWKVDLYALARQRLADAGVTRIFGGDLCTISDSQRFYSHRRDARTGRMATLVWMQR
ncbi:peptidoglycan editing factor PgeF [Pseudoxanthomonas sp. UTMC 1351]|uniref:peptidoglycan editing factor PgeF n=1 Tax=Pseudoxanthomonas sp. UTMC 1351 TaxID=2695853 RepID=UPI0034CFC537